MNAKINVNTQNMPPYLSEGLIGRWVENFFMGDVSPLAPKLHVTFSMEEKVEEYGILSLEEAKEEIKNLFPKEEIKKWLEECLSPIETKEELWESAEMLAYCPKNLFEVEYDGKAVFERIQEIASSVKFTSLCLGEYRHASRTIVLYTSSIVSTCCGKTEEQAFEEVFAHELFHAYHYFDLHHRGGDEDILFRTDATWRVVLESLASYYENAYCKRYKISTDLWAVWGRNEPAIYPYAGAKYIRDEREFKEIFEASFDLDAALRKLLFKDRKGCKQFYMVKNGAILEERVIIRPVKAPSFMEGYINAVCNHCREQLNAEFSQRSTRYFNTEKMREYFRRHGEEIESKMRIVCQNEGKRVNIYLEMHGEQGVSPALDLLRADSRIKALCNSDRSGKKFTCVISRVKVIGLNELADAAGNPRPFSGVVENTINSNLQPFREKLFELENILDSL